jgi:hypothetical protein
MHNDRASRRRIERRGHGQNHESINRGQLRTQTKQTRGVSDADRDAAWQAALDSLAAERQGLARERDALDADRATLAKERATLAAEGAQGAPAPTV